MGGRNQRTDGEVGYGRPPKHSQFKKGRSGNPGGRRKGAGSFAAALRAEGDELVTLTLNGKRVRRTKRQFAAQVAWAEALKGNFKLLELINKIDGEPLPDENEEEYHVKLERLIRSI